MVEITCSRSGLKFEAENRRTKVHPQISRYTAHKDWALRATAVSVIERGKVESWNTVERFEAEIQAALNPPPPPEIEWDLECYWVAQVSGYSEKFGYIRNFVKEVEKRGRFKRFNLTCDGLYESCYKSNKGNQTRQFWKVENGVRSEIAQSELDSLLGDRPQTKQERLQSLEDCEKVETGEKYLGEAGTKVNWQEKWYEIVDGSVKVEYEDEDGIVTSYYPRYTDCVAEYRQHTYWLRPLSTEESSLAQESAESQRAIDHAAADAVKKLKEIALGAWTGKPENASPQGLKVGYRDKALTYDSPYLQIDIEAGLLWRISYNWREGDDWRFNNLNGSHIALTQPLTPELLAEVERLAEAIQEKYPEAIQ